jgi:hypothetical protein
VFIVQEPIFAVGMRLNEPKESTDRLKRTKKTARTLNCPCREASDATYKLCASREFSVPVPA